MIMKSGIYIIENNVNKKRYVGSSCDVFRREKEHFSALRLNKHCNLHLQNAVIKYGIKNFLFFVIEFVNEDNLIEKEQFWIDMLEVCSKGYNKSKVAGGLKHGHLLSVETKILMSKPKSNETKERMRESALSRSLEVKLKAGKGRWKSVVCSNGLVFECANEAVDWLKSIGYLKANRSCIGAAINGVTKFSYGFKWSRGP